MKTLTTLEEFLDLINEWHSVRTNLNEKSSSANKILKNISKYENNFLIEELLNVLNSKKINDWQKLYLAGIIYRKSNDKKMIALIKNLLESKDIFTKWDAETFFMLHKDIKI